MKSLKLVGLENYNGPKTKNKLILKGQVVRVEDADAAYMTREGTHEVVNSMQINHWEVVPDDHTVTYDFTPKADTKVPSIIEKVGELPAVPAPVVQAAGSKVAKRSQRAPRAA